jgi:hypothetical protein
MYIVDYFLSIVHFAFMLINALRTEFFLIEKKHFSIFLFYFILIQNGYIKML